jgi:hypothetical protein
MKWANRAGALVSAAKRQPNNRLHRTALRTAAEPEREAQRYALALCWEITVELSSIRYRNGLQEVKEDVLFILRRICLAGLKLL